MGYAITATSWRQVTPDLELTEGEAYVEELPDWLIEAAARNEAVRSAQSTSSQLQAIADEKISPLQAGVDIGEISDEDLERWKAWKRYLIALSKTPELQGWPDNPDWPVPPDF
jgi:hypothetical protein